MQPAYWHDERSGESYKVLDGKNNCISNWKHSQYAQANFGTLRKVTAHFLRCILRAGLRPSKHKLSDSQVLTQAIAFLPINSSNMVLNFAQQTLHIEFQKLKFVVEWSFCWLRAVLPDSVVEQ